MSERARVVGPEGLTPLPDGLKGDSDAAFREPILDIAETQAKAVGQPDRVTDNLRRKAGAAGAGRQRATV